MKDTKYNIGLTLIILAFFACTISYYLLIFGLPIFLIGAILIFISKKPVKTKILSAFLPIVLWFPTTFMFLYFYGKTTPETYLIPKDFQGKIRVIYGEQCGIEPKEENGRRVLEIPSNGILIIKPDFEPGIVDNEYYFIDKSGHKTEVYKLYKGTGFEKNKIGIFLDGTGSIGGQMPDGSLSSESPFAIHFSDYYICNRDTDLYGNFQIESRFDSLTHAQVDQCRQKK